MNALLAVFAALFAVGGMGSSGGGGSSSSNGSSDTDDTSKTLAALSDPDETFYAADGLLVLEAESGEASGHWESTTIDGETAMLWDAESNSYNKVQEDETLAFEFVAEEAGTYYISVYGARVSSAMDPDDVRSDTGNDAYYRITNLETGEVILDPTKLYVGLGDADEELKWGDTFDKNDNKSDAKVTLEADTAYSFEIIGRSDGHAIDRVTLQKDEPLRDTEVEESEMLMDSLTLPYVETEEMPTDEEELVEFL
ncbi:MAG: hypothetical protein AAFR73_09475 [Pseudomonadota bacterium]